jgi:hypothetical protein
LKEEGLAAFLDLPLIANNEALGALVFFTREAHQFAPMKWSFYRPLPDKRRSPFITRNYTIAASSKAPNCVMPITSKMIF